MTNVNGLYNWKFNLVEIFKASRCWGLSTRTLNQKGGLGTGRGGGWKNEKHFRWKILSRDLKQVSFRLLGTR